MLLKFEIFENIYINSQKYETLFEIFMKKILLSIFMYRLNEIYRKNLKLFK